MLLGYINVYTNKVFIKGDCNIRVYQPECLLFLQTASQTLLILLVLCKQAGTIMS